MASKPASPNSHFLDRFIQRHPLLKMIDRLAVANGLGSRLPQRAMLVQQASDLVQQTRLKHRRNPTLNPFVKDRTSMPEREHPALVSFPSFRELHLPVTDRLACRFENLQCPNESTMIVWMQVCCRHRIDHLKSLVQKLATHLLKFLLDFLAKIPVGRWTLKHASK